MWPRPHIVNIMFIQESMLMNTVSKICVRVNIFLMQITHRVSRSRQLCNWENRKTAGTFVWLATRYLGRPVDMISVMRRIQIDSRDAVVSACLYARRFSLLTRSGDIPLGRDNETKTPLQWGCPSPLPRRCMSPNWQELGLRNCSQYCIAKERLAPRSSVIMDTWKESRAELEKWR